MFFEGKLVSFVVNVEISIGDKEANQRKEQDL